MNGLLLKVVIMFFYEFKVAVTSYFKINLEYWEQKLKVKPKRHSFWQGYAWALKSY